MQYSGDEPAPARFCRCGPARALAADARPRSPGPARGAARLAAGRRADAEETAREARPRAAGRPARPPAAPLRAARAGEADRGPLRRRGGADPGRGAEDVAATWPRPPADPDRAGLGRLRPDQRDLVQPAVAAGEAEAGDARAPARRAEPVRLRGALVRPQRQLRDRRFRAGLSGERGDLGRKAARARRGGAAVRDRPPGSPARRLESAARPAVPRRRTRVDPQAALARGSGSGEAAARLRRAARAPARARPAHGGAGGAGRGRAARAGRADRPLSHRAPVRADRAPGGGDRRDRRRPRPHDADAAAAPGRRRLGQDGRGALRASAGGRGRPPGGADGAHRDARRAALPHDRGSLHGARCQLRARHRLGQVEDRRPGGRRRRHARADPEGLRVPRPRRRRRRRAAPLRRRAAFRARRGPRSRMSCT